MTSSKQTPVPHLDTFEGYYPDSLTVLSGTYHPKAFKLGPVAIDAEGKPDFSRITYPEQATDLPEETNQVPTGTPEDSRTPTMDTATEMLAPLTRSMDFRPYVNTGRGVVGETIFADAVIRGNERIELMKKHLDEAQVNQMAIAFGVTQALSLKYSKPLLEILQNTEELQDIVSSGRFTRNSELVYTILTREEQVVLLTGIVNGLVRNTNPENTTITADIVAKHAMKILHNGWYTQSENGIRITEGGMMDWMGYQETISTKESL